MFLKQIFAREAKLRGQICYYGLIVSQTDSLTAAWLAQLVERQSAVREVEGSSPGPDQHSGS